MADGEKTKSKRPGNSAFKQQRLKAWQPILTPKTVLPAFFLIGLCFLPLGIGLFITSNGVQEILIDYTYCDINAPVVLSPTNAPANVFQWSYNSATMMCTIQFYLNSTFNGPVYMYYRLTNYYQNHRRYVQSFSSSQLLGKALSIGDISSDCNPLYQWQNETSGDYYPIYPCGLIANSLFNDSFSNLTAVGGGTLISFSTSGIAWPSDKNKYANTSYQPNQAVPPPNWSKYNGTYAVLGYPDIANDEAFMVWMRTAGLPNFRKLYAITQTTLIPDLYEIQILTQYNVTSFSGTKGIVLSTTSWLGGKNPFLGIAYMVVGSLCLALGIGFLIRHMIKPRKLGDQTLLSWNQTRS